MSQTISRRQPPYSDAVQFGGLLFISGQLGVDRNSGILQNKTFEQEVIQAMENIHYVLTSNGTTFSNLVNVTIYLKDISNYQPMNTIYLSYFAEKLPARTCIAAADLPMHANIEITAMAAMF